MPVGSSSAAEDLASSDEIKVFEDEGDGDDMGRPSADLTDLKSSLITESDQVCFVLFVFVLLLLPLPKNQNLVKFVN